MIAPPSPGGRTFLHWFRAFVSSDLSSPESILNGVSFDDSREGKRNFLLAMKTRETIVTETHPERSSSLLQPSLAGSIANFLSKGSAASRRGILDVHIWDGTFLGRPAQFKMTSVIGHVRRSTAGFCTHDRPL